MPRTLNTAGPPVPGQHYMIEPLSRIDLPAVEVLIEEQRAGLINIESVNVDGYSRSRCAGKCASVGSRPALMLKEVPLVPGTGPQRYRGSVKAARCLLE